jgi:hypothetical protein
LQGGGANARSTVELATYPYGSTQEYDLITGDDDAGSGKWSITKQAGKVFVTIKVSAHGCQLRVCILVTARQIVLLLLLLLLLLLHAM